MAVSPSDAFSPGLICLSVEREKAGRRDASRTTGSSVRFFWSCHMYGSQARHLFHIEAEFGAGVMCLAGRLAGLALPKKLHWLSAATVGMLLAYVIDPMAVFTPSPKRVAEEHPRKIHQSALYLPPRLCTELCSQTNCVATRLGSKFAKEASRSEIQVGEVLERDPLLSPEEIERAAAPIVTAQTPNP
ncbi:hypothetical protein IWX49DRAFT_101474 [Phyllosticta citricarpa]|uniref:Uncharacterized protein n=2 Tax=Phyllosticta TaxID=121621 RepID=A0ABR1MP88_9PEZI